MSKIQVVPNKTLRLENVLICRINIEEENVDINMIIEKMQNYISVKGAKQKGPLIQYTKTYINAQKKMDVEISMCLQCDKYIHNVEKPYYMKSILRITNCMYCRYIGPEEKLQFAYDKINIEAFENNIEIMDESYTVFVDQSDEMLIADVFVPKVEE